MDSNADSEAMLKRVTENLAAVRQRISEAARRVGRSADDIRLVGVTKYVDAALARALNLAGCEDLGESRPQELWDKAAALEGLDVQWHLIGHLQRNKVRRTISTGAWVHSVDSLRLLDALDAEAAIAGATVTALLEVNVSHESHRHGFRSGDLEALVTELDRWPNVRVRGLMAMATQSDDDQVRGEFASVRELRDRLGTTCANQVELVDLSMGMSGDYELAVEQGATIVRIGSALFEGLFSDHRLR